MTIRGKTEGVLLADIGGTNVRFAVLKESTLGPIQHMAVADHEQFADAFAIFMASRPDDVVINRAIFGVAGVVENGRCALTNSSWVVDAKALSGRFGLKAVQIVNDFEAVAWCLPELERKDLRRIGGHKARPEAPKLAIGPGTGFGAAVYVPGKEHGFVLRSEAGHSTLPSGSVREDAIVEHLRRRFGHVSAERVVSGHGLENLYYAIATVESRTVPDRSAAEITQAAIANSCTTSRAAVDMFCALFGEVAGNFALSFGAQGGVFIAGGIATHLRDYLAQSQFRLRFDAKGRMRRYVEEIPVYVILNDDPAFIGLQSLAEQRTLHS